MFPWRAPWDGPFDDVIGNRRNIAAVTIEFSNFVQRSQACSACGVYSTFPPVCHTVGALYVWSDLASLEVLHVSNVVDHFLRRLAERIERAILL